MFSNIGKKIKTLSQIFCGLGIGFSVIIGFAYLFLGSLWGIAIMILGSLYSWIGSFMSYGFGELIEKTTNIENELKNSHHLHTGENYNKNNNRLYY